MMPVSEKIFVRLTKDLLTALDHYVEKLAHKTPGIRLTRSDAIRACLHRCLQEELHELETLRAQSGMVRITKEAEPHWEKT